MQTATPTKKIDPLGLDVRDAGGVATLPAPTARLDPLGLDKPTSRVRNAVPKLDPLGLDRRSAPAVPLETPPASADGPTALSAGSALTDQGVNLPAVTEHALAYSKQTLGRDLTPDEVSSITARVAGASPVTPRELQVQQAQEHASHNPLRAAVQGAKMALGAPLAVFSPEAHELAVHEQMVEHPVADTGLNKVAGIVGSSIPMAAEYAVNPALAVATSAASGAGQARTEAMQQRDLGNQVSGGQEGAAAVVYALIDALNAFAGGKAFQGIGGSVAKRVGVNVGMGAGGAGLSQLAKNVTAQQSIAPDRGTMQNVGAATAEGGIGGAVFGGVGEVVRAATPREVGPQATASQLRTGRENRVVERAVASKEAYDAQQAAQAETAAPRVAETTARPIDPLGIETGKPVEPASVAQRPIDPLGIESARGTIEPKTPVSAVIDPESSVTGGDVAQPPTGPRSLAERRSIEDPQTKAGWDIRRRRMQARLENDNAVPQALLKPFAGEPWADAVLQNRKAPRVTPEDGLTRRRDELGQQLREIVAREIGPDIIKGKPQGLQSPVWTGEKSPGSLVPLDQAIQHAENLPADHPAKLVLHNLRELEKNPRGTKVQKFNTNQVEDGSRVDVNGAEILTIDREEGLVKDGVTTPIPEGGLDLYGRKLLPPKEPDGDVAFPPEPIPAETRASAKPDPLGIETPSAMKTDLFGKSFIDSSGVGEQKPLFHQPNEAARVASEPIRASAEAVKPGNTGELFKQPARAGKPEPVAAVEESQRTTIAERPAYSRADLSVMSAADLRKAADTWGVDASDLNRGASGRQTVLDRIIEAQGPQTPRRSGSLADVADTTNPQPAKFDAKPATMKLTARDVELKPVEMPELVGFAKALMGDVPKVKLLPKARGLFRPQGQGEVVINPEIAKDPYQLAKTMAHEIGHLVDYLADRNITRGNLLARVKSFTPVLNGLGRMQGFLKNTFGAKGITNAELRAELMELSGWWRPGDMTSSYRKSSVELYADALSVMLNSPGELQARAPKFFKALTENFDKKPDVFKAYMDLQDALTGTPAELAAQRRKSMLEGFAKAEDAIRKSAEERQDADTSIWGWARSAFSDQARPVTDMTASLVREKGATPENLTAKYAMDELGYSANVNHVMLSRIQKDVVDPLAKMGVSQEEFGHVLAMHRISTERAEMPNPGGHTAETAKAQLADTRQRIGEDAWKKLIELKNAFHEVVHESVERAVEVGTYNRELYETTIKPNKYNYAAFGVTDFLKDKIPASIKQQVGTFKDIGNPFTLTVMKTMSLNRLNELQAAKNTLRDWMKENFPAELGKPVKLDKHHQDPIPGPGKENLIILEDGKPVAYEVDSYVAGMFKRHDIGTLAKLARGLSIWTYLRHPLYITGSPGFQVSNVFRDLKRTWVNLGSLHGTSMKQVFKAYWDAKGPAWRRARGIDDATVTAMLKEKALDAPFNRIEYGVEGDQSAAYERLLKQHGLGDATTARGKLTDTLASLWHGVETIGTFIETVPKVAGFRVISNQPDVSPRERSYQIRNFIGTPNLRRRGLATDLSNGAIMYSNAAIQGARADYEIATKPTTRSGWALRRMAIDVAPKMLQKAAIAGAFGGTVAAMLKSIPSYDLANYTVIPLGATGEGDEKKTVYLRIPHDETGRLLGTILWATMSGDGFSNVLGEAASGMPGVSPGLSDPWKMFQVARGQNPTDFRDKPILTDDEFKAGGMHAVKGMLRWQLGQLGVVSEIGRGFIPRADGTHERTTIENVVGVAPGFNRILKISDKGISEDQWDQIATEEAEAARFRLGLPDEARQLVRERYKLNRLDLDGLGAADLRRLGALDDFYADYLRVTKAMKQNDVLGRSANNDKLKAELKTAAIEAVKSARPKTPEQQEHADELLRQKVLKSDMTTEQQDKVLTRAGVKLTAEQELGRELSTLRKVRKSASDNRAEYDSLLRQSVAATRRGDPEQAAGFRRQAAELQRSMIMPPADVGRLQRLEQIHTTISQIRQRMKEGIIPKAAGERQIENLLKSAARKAAA